ncbi:hypothetical protein J8273_1558 [Carpediemonas membranifera]|uniref:VWFA domain-containing protein n=1 Tax=Carpediemonas membranifera TaxID=201153 RepID=A0A8J6EB86_9EUKA|nr:hypothetical protein J8273_1558 [Carpediemonas membranifera]|eukprot:KAG9396550.1 hypothetical protein J8273_1558 [Carpediemonas membranifera]
MASHTGPLLTLATALSVRLRACQRGLRTLSDADAWSSVLREYPTLIEATVNNTVLSDGGVLVAASRFARSGVASQWPARLASIRALGMQLATEPDHCRLAGVFEGLYRAHMVFEEPFRRHYAELKGPGTRLLEDALELSKYDLTRDRGEVKAQAIKQSQAKTRRDIASAVASIRGSTSEPIDMFLGDVDGRTMTFDREGLAAIVGDLSPVAVDLADRWEAVRTHKEDVSVRARLVKALRGAVRATGLPRVPFNTREPEDVGKIYTGLAELLACDAPAHRALLQRLQYTLLLVFSPWDDVFMAGRISEGTDTPMLHVLQAVNGLLVSLPALMARVAPPPSPTPDPARLARLRLEQVAAVRTDVARDAIDRGTVDALPALIAGPITRLLAETEPQHRQPSDAEAPVPADTLGPTLSLALTMAAMLVSMVHEDVLEHIPEEELEDDGEEEEEEAGEGAGLADGKGTGKDISDEIEHEDELDQVQDDKEQDDGDVSDGGVEMERDIDGKEQDVEVDENEEDENDDEEEQEDIDERMDDDMSGGEQEEQREWAEDDLDDGDASGSDRELDGEADLIGESEEEEDIDFDQAEHADDEPEPDEAADESDDGLDDDAPEVDTEDDDENGRERLELDDVSDLDDDDEDMEQAEQEVAPPEPEPESDVDEEMEADEVAGEGDADHNASDDDQDEAYGQDTQHADTGKGSDEEDGGQGDDGEVEREVQQVNLLDAEPDDQEDQDVEMDGDAAQSDTGEEAVAEARRGQHEINREHDRADQEQPDPEAEAPTIAQAERTQAFNIKVGAVQLTRADGAALQHVPTEVSIHDGVDAAGYAAIRNRVQPGIHRLTEQLSTVLEPTERSQLVGNFRTGKRLSMRRLVQFVASQYVQNNIWLRRTKPAKRDYSVVIAVDTSRSMQASADLAKEALVLLTSALNALETGPVCVVGFGEGAEVYHPLEQLLPDAHLPGILDRVKFEDKTTDFAGMLDAASSIFDSAGPRQVLLIISDGSILQDEAAVASKVRGLISKGVLPLLIALNKGDLVDRIRITFANGAIQRTPVLDMYPFPYYILLGDSSRLPDVTADALRQCFDALASTI